MSRINWKTSLLAAALLPALAQAADERFIVKFKDGTSNGGAIAESMGARVIHELGPQNAVAVMASERAMQGLQRNPNVEYAELDVPRQMLAQSTPYGIDMVQAPLVWPTATGANRKVCIIDSGFSLGHADLQSTSVTGYPAGWNTDSCGHGSHVAGTIAALNNTDGVVGVLPNGVNLHIVKVFGDDCAWTYSSTLVDALNRCTGAGANVVSMSLGGGLKSKTEETAFQNAWNAGVISVAAAGNDGNNRMSYPASYPSVISVAALDSTKTVATFSQFNSAVDVAAPGVAVLSTVPWKETNTLSVDGATYQGSYIDLAPRSTGVSGALVYGGLCDSVGAWSGKVVLCERGTVSFYDKVHNVQLGGGTAAVIYNNAPGGFLGTLGAGNTSTIPAISLSQEDGQFLVANKLGLPSTVASFSSKPDSGYEAWDGTSMATPHVSAVAALIWSAKTTRTNAQIRQALEATAEDLGAAGRDNYYGAGLVRAKAALDYLNTYYP
jgi:subtilisin family serine protease